MNGDIKQGSNEARHTGWDALIVALLGGALLAAGWLDARTYLAHRGRAIRPRFAFLERAAFEQIGEDELYRDSDTSVLLDNVAGLEGTRTDHFRHGLGPRTTILLWTQRGHGLLNLRFKNPIQGQNITVSCNGQVLKHSPTSKESVIVRKYPLTLLPGRNEIAMAFALYNHAGSEVASGDSRPIAGTFETFELTLD